MFECADVGFSVLFCADGYRGRMLNESFLYIQCIIFFNTVTRTCSVACSVVIIIGIDFY
jgi:hypothetical protein